MPSTACVYWLASRVERSLSAAFQSFLSRLLRNSCSSLLVMGCPWYYVKNAACSSIVLLAADLAKTGREYSICGGKRELCDVYLPSHYSLSPNFRSFLACYRLAPLVLLDDLAPFELQGSIL